MCGLKISMVDPNDGVKVFMRKIEGNKRDWSKVDVDGLPVITIITSTFNAEKELPRTIASIRSQTYKKIQWIVADGGSTDKTIKLLEENEDLVDVWFSEPDSGIYDAWNKAVLYIKGDWVQFVGAGDEIADSNTAESVSRYLIGAYPKHDLVYGRVQYLHEISREILYEFGCPWEEINKRWDGLRPMLPSHPGVFHHKTVLGGGNAFDTTYKIAGDSNLLLGCIKNKDPLYVPVLVDKMPSGGVSSNIKTFFVMCREVKRAARENGYRTPLAIYIGQNAKIYGLEFLWYALPEKMFFRILRFYCLVFNKKIKWVDL